MLSRSQAFAAAFSAKKALLNVNATVNAERTFTFSPSMAVRSAEAAATYWNSRQAEVDSRQKAADERKKKYARTGGEN